MGDYLLDPSQYVDNHINTNTGLYNNDPVQLLRAGIAPISANQQESNAVQNEQIGQTLGLIDIIVAFQKENVFLKQTVAKNNNLKKIVYILLVLLIALIVVFFLCMMHK